MLLRRLLTLHGPYPSPGRELRIPGATPPTVPMRPGDLDDLKRATPEDEPDGPDEPSA